MTCDLQLRSKHLTLTLLVFPRKNLRLTLPQQGLCGLCPRFLFAVTLKRLLGHNTRSQCVMQLRSGVFSLSSVLQRCVTLRLNWLLLCCIFLDSRYNIFIAVVFGLVALKLAFFFPNCVFFFFFNYKNEFQIWCQVTL